MVGCLSGELLPTGCMLEIANRKAPLPHTVETFFGAIHARAASRHSLIQADTDGAVIVQLTGLQESGVRKADAYLTYVITHTPRLELMR
jgi:hypothetical protein